MRDYIEPRVTAEDAVFFLLPLLLLLVPLRWFLAAVFAAAVHESFHWLALKALGAEIVSIRVGIFGTKMEIVPMSSGRECLAALAGPLGSLALLLLARQMPCTALCGLIQGLFNLLPVYPLDGGRALRCAVSAVVPEKLSPAVFGGLEWSVILILILLLLWLHLNRIWICVAGILVLLRTVQILLANRSR